MDEGGISGRGVHEAARISALGAGGEIVISDVALNAVSQEYLTREMRTVVLKGLPGEIQVAFLACGAP